jgi:periodic tryptophan protein 2
MVNRFLITASKDLTARVYSLHPHPSFTPLVLAGHRDAVVGAFFSPVDKRLFTVSKDGAVFAWHWLLFDDATNPAGTDGSRSG